MAKRRRLTPAQPGYLAPQSSGASAPPIAQVAGEAAGASALREMAEGIRQARDEGRMIVEVPLADIAPGFLVRDRIAVDREEIEVLKTSIRKHGQRTPAEITPLAGGDGDGSGPYAFGLISGWRRLRALSELYEETDDLRFSTLRALLRPPEEASASYVAMVEENEIRVGLSYYERARVVSEAAARGVFEDQSAALRGLFGTASRAKRSKIGSFMQIHEDLGDLLRFPAEIPERLGLALVSRLRFGAAKEIRRTLRETRPATAAAEMALLTRLAAPPRASVSRAKQPGEKLRGNVAMALARKGGRITVTLSGKGVDDTLLDEVRTALRGLG